MIRVTDVAYARFNLKTSVGENVLSEKDRYI